MTDSQVNDWLLQILLTQPRSGNKGTICHHTEENIQRVRQLLLVGLREPSQHPGGQVSSVTWLWLFRRQSMSMSFDQDACEEGESRQLLVLWQRLAAGPGALLVAVCGGASPDPGQGSDLPSRRIQLQRPHCSLQVTDCPGHHEWETWHAFWFSVSVRLIPTLWRQSLSWALVTMWGYLAAQWASVTRTKLPSEISPSTKTSPRSSWTQVMTLTP